MAKRKKSRISAKEAEVVKKIEAANAQIQQGGKPPFVPIQAPLLYASTVQCQGVGNDFNLVFLKHVPVSEGEHAMSPRVAMQQVTVVLQLSAHTLKDLAVLLPPVVARYEKEHGLLQTAFTKRQNQIKDLAAAEPASNKKN